MTIFGKSFPILVREYQFKFGSIFQSRSIFAHKKKTNKNGIRFREVGNHETLKHSCLFMYLLDRRDDRSCYFVTKKEGNAISKGRNVLPLLSYGALYIYYRKYFISLSQMSLFILHPYMKTILYFAGTADFFFFLSGYRISLSEVFRWHFNASVCHRHVPILPVQTRSVFFKVFGNEPHTGTGLVHGDESINGLYSQEILYNKKSNG